MSKLPNAPETHAGAAVSLWESSTTDRPAWRSLGPLGAALPQRLRRMARVAWGHLQASGTLPLLGKQKRRLRVSETLALGDKRFVSILEVDGQSFLVGSAGTGMSLLATLNRPEMGAETSFPRVLRESLQREAAG